MRHKRLCRLQNTRTRTQTHRHRHTHTLSLSRPLSQTLSSSPGTANKKCGGPRTCGNEQVDIAALEAIESTESLALHEPAMQRDALVLQRPQHLRQLRTRVPPTNKHNLALVGVEGVEERDKRGKPGAVCSEDIALVEGGDGRFIRPNLRCVGGEGGQRERQWSGRGRVSSRAHVCLSVCLSSLLV